MLRIFLKAFGLGWLLPAPFITIEAKEVHDLMHTKPLLLIDVRRPDEWQRTGMAMDSQGITSSNDTFIEEVSKIADQDKSKQIALICHAGSRSQDAALKLSDNGFKNIISVDGGMQAWSAADLPVSPYA